MNVYKSQLSYAQERNPPRRLSATKLIKRIYTRVLTDTPLNELRHHKFPDYLSLTKPARLATTLPISGAFAALQSAS